MVRTKVDKPFKVIPLTQGMETMIDTDDYDWLIAVGRWRAHRSPGGLYVVTNIRADGRWRMVRMHRLIMGAPDGVMVDHKNRNALDNRRQNLRFCTNTQNIRNRGSFKNSTSRYKGVHWSVGKQKWRALLRIAGKLKHLGYYDNELDAACAYDVVAAHYHGEFACLNRPDLLRQMMTETGD